MHRVVRPPTTGMLVRSGGFHDNGLTTDGSVRVAVSRRTDPPHPGSRGRDIADSRAAHATPRETPHEETAT